MITLLTLVCYLAIATAIGAAICFLVGAVASKGKPPTDRMTPYEEE